MQHLYIHWPFCKNKCHYCDFVAFEKHEAFITQYHKALCNEIMAYASQNKRHKIKTIFFGGGTPSLYPLHLLKKLFDLLHKYFDLSEAKEISLEVNPGGIYEQHLVTWKSLGINRLSIGVQVLDDDILKNLNRIQTNRDVYELMDIVPKYFSNFSNDLILGLPGVTNEIWQSTLDQITAWPITHVSIYMLMVHEKTPLYFREKKGELKVLGDDDSVMLYENTVKYLEDKRLIQYETSNFARPGFESIHNKSYWDHKPYLGFGLGAVSFDGEVRTTNLKSLTRYLDQYCDGVYNLAYESTEKISDNALRIERLMLGLRQKEGLDLHSVLYLFKRGERKRVLNRLEILEGQKLIAIHGDRVALTVKGMSLENEVVLSLI